MNDKITVIYHRADFDGLFCREIARKFLPNAELIGWDYKDKRLTFPSEGLVYVLDLSPDCFESVPEHTERIIWIDHHKTAINKFNPGIAGYRIDGVAACRLAWQWFTNDTARNVMSDASYLPEKLEYVNRAVTEPLAVRLAGEYDIWDKRDPNAELFQHGLRSMPFEQKHWDTLLLTGDVACRDLAGTFIDQLLYQGQFVRHYFDANNAEIVNERSFLVNFAGLKFLALNTPRFNSQTFAIKDVPETGHDALMGFYYDGEKYNVSLYHAKHRTDLDLSAIAQTFSFNGRPGGGHKGACGFATEKLPFIA